MKKWFCCLLIVMFGVCGVSHAFLTPASARQEEETDIFVPTATYEAVPLVLTTVTPVEEQVVMPEIVPEPEPEPLATQEEIELLALLTMAEAEGESELGQRLVIDTVLNRVDDPHFPNTISEVVWQKNQFSGMYGERIKRCYVMDSLVQLVLEELENRTNYEVVFFRTERYSDYGVPLFQEDHHYFSSYE